MPDRQTNFILKAKDAASGPIGKVAHSLHDLEQKATRLGGRALGGVASGITTLAKVAATAAAAGLAALAAGFTASIVKAAQFEAAMNNVNSIAKASPEQFEVMRQAVLGLSRELPQSAETLAKGLYNIASSGFAGADGLKVLEAAAKAASAGLSTTDEAAKGITAVLNAYGYGAERAEYVSDVLFRTVDRGVITFGELAEQIGDVTSIAPLVGVSLEEVGAAMAVLTKNGINAAESATAVSALLRSILKPSQEAADLAKELGLEWNIAALEAKGLAGFINDLTVAAGDNDEALAILAGDARAIKSTFILARDGGSQFREELELMYAAAGATDTALSYQKQGLSYQFQILKNNISAAAITIGTGLLPKITPLVMEITEFVQALFATDEPLQNLRGHLEGTGDESDRLQVKLAEWGPLGQIVGDAIGFIRRSFEELQTQWQEIGPIIAEIARGFLGPGGILESVTNVGREIFIWLLPKLRDLWTTLTRDVAPSIMGVVRPIAQELLPKIGSLVNAIFGGAGHRGLIPAIGDLAAKMWGDGTGPLARAIQITGALLGGLATKISEIADNIARLVDAISAAYTFAQQVQANLAGITIPGSGVTFPQPAPYVPPPTTTTGGTSTGTTFGGLQEFQHGGFTSGRHPILVGEAGPEVFVPGGPGTVIPNMGGRPVEIPIYLDGREIARVVDRHLYYMRSPAARLPR